MGLKIYFQPRVNIFSSIQGKELHYNGRHTCFCCEILCCIKVGGIEIDPHLNDGTASN